MLGNGRFCEQRCVTRRTPSVHICTQARHGTSNFFLRPIDNPTNDLRVPVKIAQQQLGHASIQTTLNI
jgi:hypothetical protein